LDPLTQGALGAIAAQAVCGKHLPRSAWLIGAAAGMAADLDVLIRPAGALLGGLTYHRHFTHALVFIPIGALLSAIPFLLFPRLRRHWPVVLLAALVAYATHGLLDSFTSYGTVLFWPFSEARVAWDIMPIVDPVYTLLLIAGLCASVALRRRSLAVVGATLSLAYMSFAAVQHTRALDVQGQLVEKREHAYVRGRALPTPFNLAMWRSIYEADGLLYADVVRVPYFRAAEVRLGAATPIVTLETLEAEQPLGPELRAVFERFAWFADGYTAWDQRAHRTIGDMRYGVSPEVFASLWGLELPEPGEDGQARFVRLHMGWRTGLRRMWVALWGHDPLFHPVTAVIAKTDVGPSRPAQLLEPRRTAIDRSR
jgi:inner membrane protein